MASLILAPLEASMFVFGWLCTLVCCEQLFLLCVLIGGHVFIAWIHAARLGLNSFRVICVLWSAQLGLPKSEPLLSCLCYFLLVTDFNVAWPVTP